MVLEALALPGSRPPPSAHTLFIANVPAESLWVQQHPCPQDAFFLQIISSPVMISLDLRVSLVPRPDPAWEASAWWSAAPGAGKPQPLLWGLQPQGPVVSVSWLVSRLMFGCHRPGLSWKPQDPHPLALALSCAFYYSLLFWEGPRQMELWPDDTVFSWLVTKEQEPSYLSACLSLP